MRTLISLAHISLDGFMADAKGNFNFVPFNSELADHTYPLIHSVDTSVYGRITYEMMQGYWPNVGDDEEDAGTKTHARWYKGVNKIVASRTLKTDDPTARVVGEDIVGVLRAEKEKAGGDIMIFASPTLTHTLAAAGIVDEWRLSISPVALGGGLPLWREKRTNMELVSTKTFTSGVIAAHYVTKR